ncbi:hypothetical protein [Aureibacter tunicatorum]|uniref:Lipoprotein n=1 Tax=Aureibacter tunicatorum TaxID=866807 RepID=A0AAE3XMP8_9BACT|nr:hypothetical protein [Aureibacter tunicatorum]MDR6239777.1 hypothetical protein [Aureibacter tunicatorum]BDD04252.1 hypothetical protein AUTU_17350 [Aureibacter tunicatorum]
MRNLLILICVGTMLFSCQGGIDLKGFDSASWKGDRHGCEAYRSSIYKDIVEQREQVLGKTIREVNGYFGNPNITELARKDQKYYLYQVTKDSTCQGFDSDTKQIYLRLRFSAVGIVNEVTLDIKN